MSASTVTVPNAEESVPSALSLLSVPSVLPSNVKTVPRASPERSIAAIGANPLMKRPSPSVVKDSPSSLKSGRILLKSGSPDSRPVMVPQTPLWDSEKSRPDTDMSLTGPFTSASLRLMTDFIRRSDGAK